MTELEQLFSQWQDLQPINEVYSLGEDLSKGNISKNEANLETMDVLLKYKIVSPKTARQLVILDKLDGVSGLDSVIKKYE